MKRFLLSILLIPGLITSPSLALAAQPAATDTSFESALSGDVIDMGTSGQITFLPESYDLSQGQTVAEEYIWFTYNVSNFELVIVEGDIAVDEYYDLTLGNMVDFYHEFEVIEEDIGTDRAWFLADVNYQGTELVVFYDYELDALGEYDLLVMQFAPAGSLVTDMEFVQQEVTVGEQPLLRDTNLQEIRAVLDGDTTGTSGGDTTPESGSGTGGGITERMGRVSDPVSGETPTAQATETTRTTRTTRSARATGTEAATATETTSTPVRTTRTTRSTGSTQTTSMASGEWESMGLVSDTEWISPHFGTSVTWDGASWVFPADNENAIFLSEDGDSDQISLQPVDGEGMGHVMVSDAGTLIPADLVGFWSSPHLMRGPNNEQVVVIDVQQTGNAAAVVYQFEDENGETVNMVVTVWFQDDGTMITTRMISSPENASTVYGQFIDGLQVNNESVGSFLIYTPEDIAELAG
jgi:hypothetical protein